LAREQTSTDLPTAGSFFGLGANKSYELAHAGQFPTRVLRLGRRLRVPTADILSALGLVQDAPGMPSEEHGAVDEQ